MEQEDGLRRRKRGGEAQALGCCLLVILLGVAGVLALLSTQGRGAYVVAPQVESRNALIGKGTFVRSEATRGVHFPSKTYDSFAAADVSHCKKSCEADRSCGTWAFGKCFGGEGLQAHVCYLGEASADVAALEPVADPCADYGGRVVRITVQAPSPPSPSPSHSTVKIVETARASASAQVAISASQAPPPVLIAHSAQDMATSYAEAAAEYDGDVYKSFAAVDAQRCKLACLLDHRCDNWVIGLCVGGAGLQAHVCYLKTHVDAQRRVRDECAAFGGTVERAISSQAVHEAVVIAHAAGVNYRSFATRERAQCQSECEADARCLSWVHGLCGAGGSGASECYLSTAAQPQWPVNDKCAVFGGSVDRSSEYGYGVVATPPPSELVPRAPAGSASPTRPPPPRAVAVPAAAAAAESPANKCVSSLVGGKVSVTCHSTIPPPPQQQHQQHRQYSITVKEAPAAPPPPAPPKSVEMFVQLPRPPPPPPAAPAEQPVQININENATPAGDQAATFPLEHVPPAAPTSIIEGARQHGNHLVIHVNPQEQEPAEQNKVITLQMGAAAPLAQPVFVQNVPIVAHVAPVVQSPNCQSTTTADGTVVTCTSAMP